MAKFDKELLIKHNFWILLGSFLLIWGVAMIVLLASAGGAVAEKKKDYDTMKDTVSGLASKGHGLEGSKMATPSFTDAVAKREQKLKVKKDLVWIAAWNAQDEKRDPATDDVIQEALLSWPTDLAQYKDTRTNVKVKDKYFGEPIDGDAQESSGQRDKYRDTLYLKQLDYFHTPTETYPTPIAPAYYNGSWDRVIVPVVWEKITPSNRDVWLAQEDFCVKREMVRVLREAIDAVGRCSQVKLDPAKDPPAPGTVLQRVRNTGWELDLVLEKDKKGLVQIGTKSTLKNIHPDTRTLARSGLVFRVQQRDANGILRTPVLLHVEGEPMGRFDEEKKGPVEPLLKKDPLPLAGFDDQQPLEVDQIFNWYNSPIKRLDRLEVGTAVAQAHRMTKRGLVTAKQFPQEETAPAAGTGTGTGSPEGGVGPMGGFGPMGGGFGPMGGGYGGNQANQQRVPVLRYIDLSEQVRRLPVGLVLVLDQAYIPDVLAALANSRLRTWTTQVQWKHVPAGQVPAPPEEAGGPRTPVGGAPGTGSEEGVGPSGAPSPMGPGSGVRPGGFGTPMGPGGGFGPMGPGGFGGFGGFGGGGTYDPTAGLVQDDPNLVELSIYSIASLYERYPPKASDPNAPTPQ